MTHKDLEKVPTTGDETRAMPEQEPIGIIQRGPVKDGSAGGGAPAQGGASDSEAAADGDPE